MVFIECSIKPFYVSICIVFIGILVVPLWIMFVLLFCDILNVDFLCLGMALAGNKYMFYLAATTLASETDGVLNYQ